MSDQALPRGPATAFDYDEAMTRNHGFVSPDEQRRLRQAHIFVCGVGGMGGAAVQSLVRAGVGHIGIADQDRFELSNVNRQMFANLDTVGATKTGVVANELRRINPDLDLRCWGAEWVDHLPEILTRYPIVVCGMDDMRAAIRLYRCAQERGATVIDAYTAPLPSVTAVRPGDPLPERRLGFPTAGVPWDRITDAQLSTSFSREIEYVLAHSSTARRIDMDVAADVLGGRAARPSFAPIVVTAGNLMAFEAIASALDWPTGTDCRGYFLDPWSGRIERPRRGPVSWVRRRLARRTIRRMH
jgi:hypothetical protein